MADNISVTAGPIATDDIGGVHYQRIKVSHGTDGNATDTSSTNPLPTTHIGELPSGENQIGRTSSHSVQKDITLSLSTSAYAAGDLLADSQVVDGALRVDDGTGMLISMALIDKDDQKVPLTVYLLSANVSLGTENSAPSISDANALNILGFVDFETSDYRDLGGVAIAYKQAQIHIVAASGTDDIYVAAVNGSGAPTYAADGLVLRLGILQG